MTQKETPESPYDDRYQIIDTLTGDLQPIAVYVKKSSEPWQKVWARALADMLDLTGESRTKILAYLIREKDSKNRVVATIRTISESTGVSTKTVNRTLKQLEKANCIIRLQNGAVMFSPHIIQAGATYAGVAVMRRWKAAQENEE